MKEEFFAGSLVKLPHPNKLLIVEPLDYLNPYDYKQLHRHDYFEVILIKEGKAISTLTSSHLKCREDKFLIFIQARYI